MTLDTILTNAAAVWVQYFPYTATIKLPTSTDDSYGGQVPGTPTTIASSLPLYVESLRQPVTRSAGDKITIVGTHQLYFVADENTSNITPKHEIHVDAYQDEPARVFVRPVILQSLGVVQIAAVLKQ